MKGNPTSNGSENGSTLTKKHKTEDEIHIYIGNLTDDISPEKFVITKKESTQKLFDDYCDNIVRIYRLGLSDTEELKNSLLIMRTERNYFGLRYSDYEGRLHWLENDKSVYKQLSEARARTTPDVTPTQYKITFRMKHYPAKFSELSSTLSHYLFFLQIRRDLIQGRLLCPKTEDVIKVGSLVYQAEEGDAPYADTNEMLAALNRSDDCPDACPLNKKIFLRPNDGPDIKVLKAYLELKNKMTKTQAVHALLEHVTTFPTYGIDPFQVEPLFSEKREGPARCDSNLVINSSVEQSDAAKVKRSHTLSLPLVKKKTKGTVPTSTSLILPKQGDVKPNYYLGISHLGLQMFVGTQPMMSWTWEQITNLKYSRNVFKIVSKAPEQQANKSKEVKHAFQLQSESAALSLWKWANDRRFFFTLAQGKKAKTVKSSNSIIGRKKSFKFSGQSQADVKQVVQTLPNRSDQKEIKYTSMRIVGMNPANLQKLEALGLSRTAKASTSTRPGLFMDHLDDEQVTPKRSDESQEQPSESTSGDKMDNGSVTHEIVMQRQISISSQKSTKETVEEKPITTLSIQPVTATPANGTLPNGHIKSNGHALSKPVVAKRTDYAPILVCAVAVMGVFMALAVFVLESRQQPNASSNQFTRMACQLRRLSPVDAFGKAVYDPIRDALVAQFSGSSPAPAASIKK